MSNKDLDVNCVIRGFEVAPQFSGCEFIVYFQPQVDMRTSSIVGLEALCRCRHPILGVLPPSKFIPRVEALGYSGELFFKVLEASLVMQGHLRGIAVDVPIWINAPSDIVASEGWLQKFDGVVEESRVGKKNIAIELLETGWIDDVRRLGRNVERLLSMGYEVAIDDFGNGCSNDALLAEIPFSKLKLDRSFVSVVDQNGRRSAICRHQIELASSLGVSCVAEGVETESQKTALLHLGCHYGQGYLWLPPVTAKDILGYVKNSLHGGDDGEKK